MHYPPESRLSVGGFLRTLPMPSCLWGGSYQEVAEPTRNSGGRTWPVMPAFGGHAAQDELAEAHAAARILRDQLCSANDKAALLLSYQDAAEQEHRGIRDQTRHLQVSQHSDRPWHSSSVAGQHPAHKHANDLLRPAVQCLAEQLNAAVGAARPVRHWEATSRSDHRHWIVVVCCLHPTAVTLVLRRRNMRTSRIDWPRPRRRMSRPSRRPRSCGRTPIDSR